MKLTAWHAYFATLLAGLGYFSAENPHSTGLQIALAAAGMLGTIGVPAIQEGKTMTENTPFPAPKFVQEGADAPELTNPVGARGSSLMGVTPYTPAQVPVPETAPAPPVPEPAPEPAAVTAPEDDTPVLVQYITQHAALLEEMAAGLRKLLAL